MHRLWRPETREEHEEARERYRRVREDLNERLGLDSERPFPPFRAFVANRALWLFDWHPVLLPDGEADEVWLGVLAFGARSARAVAVEAGAVPAPEPDAEGWPCCPYCGERLAFSGDCGCGYRAREAGRVF